MDLLLAPYLTDEPSSLRKVGRVECYVESAEEIIAKKIRYRRTQAKTRDIVDIGVAITQFPEILKGLVNQNTITLDELFEWRKTLSGFDRERYPQELAIIEPATRYRDVCERSPEAIVANIDAVKSDIVNS